MLHISAQALPIILNTVVLSLDHSGISHQQENIHEIILFSLSCVFFAEMCLKLVATSREEYFANGYNRFDFAIVFVKSRAAQGHIRKVEEQMRQENDIF